MGLNNVWVVDRLATEANWARIAPETESVLVLCFSLSRAVLVARRLWQPRPGVSLRRASASWCSISISNPPAYLSALLPPERQLMYGITDWLLEDLVDNGDVVFESMIATSNLSHDGEIHVVPAHGADHGVSTLPN